MTDRKDVAFLVVAATIALCTAAVVAVALASPTDPEVDATPRRTELPPATVAAFVAPVSVVNLADIPPDPPPPPPPPPEPDPPRQEPPPNTAPVTRAPTPAPAQVWPTSLQPCGGDLPPCAVKQRESGGSYSARNASSGACGAWQFIPSTWAGFGGYASACDAPPEVQDAKARALWANGAGCSHWAAC